MKIQKMVLLCSSSSGVSSTKKMQILRTKFALMRREYNQEENMKNTAKKYTREEM